MKRERLPRWFVALALVLLLAVPPVQAASAKSTATKKTSTGSKRATSPKRVARNPYLGAVVVEAASGRVLFEEGADAHGYPASMLKLMDLLIILEKIERRELSFQDQVKISAKAARTGGSQVWLAEKEVFSVDDLLYALMVQSANDAAVALAEKVAGSTDAFIQLMNQRAQALGMTNTIFRSVHGLPPSAGQQPDVTTPRDFVKLCREVLRHRDTLRYTGTRVRSFREKVPGKTVVMRNHNHLLGKLEGCDGLKTGYISAAGYSVAVTAARDGHRVITVVFDCVDRNVRDAKATDLTKRALALWTPVARPGTAPAQPKAAAR